MLKAALLPMADDASETGLPLWFVKAFGTLAVPLAYMFRRSPFITVILLILMGTVFALDVLLAYAISGIIPDVIALLHSFTHVIH